MKKIATLFFITLVSLVSAQEYIPMLEIGKIWNMEKHNDTGYVSPYVIEIIGTVQTNNLIYYRVESLFYNCEILLREDVLEKKVYRLINDQDVLMFDFSLGIGDLAVNNFPVNTFPFPLIIDEVGVGVFFNLSNLNFYGFQYYNMKYVDSIGSSSKGIISCFDEGCRANGLYDWDILVGMNEELNIIDYFSQNNISLFYNSVTKNIEVNTNEKLQITIFSTLGEKIIDSEISNQLNVMQLSKGIYIYRIVKYNSIKTGKIIIY